MRTVIIIALLVIGLIPALGQAPVGSSSGSFVLHIDNPMQHIRPGWQVPAVVQAGTFISTNDLIFPERTSLLVLCPDGRLRDFLPSELFPNDKLNCEVSPENYILNVDGVRRYAIQRGGRQDATIPYLISPRGTLIRDNDVVIRWNDPSNVREYRLRIFGGGEIVYEQTPFTPNDVLQVDGSNAVTLSVDLQPNVAYTVEICVTFNNLREGCTTDAGWSSGVNVAFFYDPDPQLGGQSVSALEQSIIAQLGENTSESLYARAVLFSQGMATNTNGDPLGLNSEAIDLVTGLLDNHPDSALANSAQVYYMLGTLYREIELPLSAARAYQMADGLAENCTEVAALTAYGLAGTDPNTNNIIGHYTASLENYTCLLDDDRFELQYQTICESIGDLCANLPRQSSF